MKRRAFLMVCALALAVSGCGTFANSIIKRDAYDFKTTGLFMKPCKELAAASTAEKKDDGGKKTFWEKINPATLVKPDPDEEKSKIENTVNDCYTTDIEKMDAAFNGIVERDESKGIPGDTITDVRKKGFSIYVDKKEKVRRPNTRPLYGNDALGCVGLAVSPPPLQKPEDVKAYTEFMIQHYCEEYQEKNLKTSSDRICINNDESLDIGDDRTYSILWRAGNVIKRIIKGGPVNNPKKQSGFLVCPGGFIGDTVKGAVGGAATGVKLGL